MKRRLPLVGAVTAVAVLAGCTANSAAGAAPSGHPSATATRTTRTAAATGTSMPKPKPKPPAPATPTSLPVDPGAGSRPQTQKYPSTHSVAFRNAMTDVWLAVTTDKPGLGKPAFFPEGAYAQLKAIPYPGADWTGRLWLDFELDAEAAHGVVGSHARLLRVDMAPSYEAAWIPPGYCYNSVGYWHINGARLVYDRDGQERSIGIASLISWRGVWYVVHFGAVIRPAVGIVDDPETGPGVPGPAGGC
jgi:hypothetical protein